MELSCKIDMCEGYVKTFFRLYLKKLCLKGMTSTSVIINYPWKQSENLKAMKLDAEDTGLTENALKIAKNELREDKNTREQCLIQFRSWIQKNEDIENVRMDDRFLLRFLRVKKFSIPMAQQILLKYLNLKNSFAHMCCNLDCLQSPQIDLINAGYIFASPIRDRLGRRILIIVVENFDPKKYTSTDMAKAHFIAYETLLDDPENQVIGIRHVVNFYGIQSRHVTNWNPTEFARIIKWGEQSLPLRHKGIHLINLPSSIKWVVDFVKGRVSSKMKDRFHTYSALDELHNDIGSECLPKEMGGKIPMKDMIELWKKELNSKRDLLLALDKMVLLSDKGIIRSRDGNNPSQSEIDSLAGSFRKLEFD